jgi:hypothetical protein
MRNRRRHTGRAAGAMLFALVGVLCVPKAPAAESDNEVDLQKAIETLIELTTKFTERTQNGIVTLLENVEMLNLEPEIDRLVGEPWALNDATTYKLSLLPYRIRYPIYQQLIGQMTRQDQLRSRRIHRVTATGVEGVALRLDVLSQDNPTDDLASTRFSSNVQSSLLNHFNVREIADLGFFVLAQQPFFPDNEVEWMRLKHQIASASLGVAATAVAAGALVNAGAFGQSGRIVASADARKQLGWYGAFSRLGSDLRPKLRAGFTGRLPGVELSAGLSEQVNPTETERTRALELAVREGWLGEMISEDGWDLYLEGALRRALESESQYEGENTTVRGGLFLKRDVLPTFTNLAFRSLAELESDLETETRFATGIGLQHRITGLSAVIQMSRTRRFIPGDNLIEDRGGIFVAGSTESPTHHFVSSMGQLAGHVRTAWNAFTTLEAHRVVLEKRLEVSVSSELGQEEIATAKFALDRIADERRLALVRLGERLADYLESRRLVYSVTRWDRPADGLHGPVDPAILSASFRAVFNHTESVREEIGQIIVDADRLNQRLARLSPALIAVAKDPTERANMDWERRAIERTLARHAMRSHQLQLAYDGFRTTSRRIALAFAKTPHPPYLPEFDELDTRLKRRLLTLQLAFPP